VRLWTEKKKEKKNGAKKSWEKEEKKKKKKKKKKKIEWLAGLWIAFNNYHREDLVGN